MLPLPTGIVADVWVTLLMAKKGTPDIKPTTMECIIIAFYCVFVDCQLLIKEIGQGIHGAPGELNLDIETLQRVDDRMIEIFSNRTIEKIAQEVKDKIYGNGDERKLKLGIMYEIVQNQINVELGYPKRRDLNEKQIEILANRAIEGEFGEGMERKEKLDQFFKRVQNKVFELEGDDKRYDLNRLYIEEYINKLYTNEITDDDVKAAVGEPLYKFIRNKVNEMNANNNRFELNNEVIETLAKETILFEFSEGDKRKEKLGELYPFVQNRVNEILGLDIILDTGEIPWYLNLEN